MASSLLLRQRPEAARQAARRTARRAARCVAPRASGDEGEQLTH